MLLFKQGLSKVNRVTRMTLSTSSITEMPAKRKAQISFSLPEVLHRDAKGKSQKTKKQDLPSSCQVTITIV